MSELLFVHRMLALGGREWSPSEVRLALWVTALWRGHMEADDLLLGRRMVAFELGERCLIYVSFRSTHCGVWARRWLVC